ncbi:MAG: glycoside hydrolase family 38 C-terminal domain-containing protein [Candidatus Sigynarchaeota archaeon]
MTPHSHYDYLWCDPPDAMGAKNAKLIKEALLLMRKYPGYKYIIDSAMAVEYFKLHYPDMMAELVQRVAENRIELMGGMVVAPDTLLARGETLARQFLHGMRYFKEQFGVEPKTGFLIDSFGITAQFPQLLAKAGLEQFIFVRGAIRRNIPQEFYWMALDGTSVLTHWMRINYAFVLPPYTGTILAPVYPFAPIPFTIALIPQAFKVHEILKSVLPPIKYLFQRIACINAGAALIGSDIGGLTFTIKRRAAQAATPNVFILCGTDNLPPSSNVLDAVEYLNHKHKQLRVHVALPRDFFQAIRESGRQLTSIGPCEMSGFMDKFTGTFSTRVRVKQAVRACENALYLAEVTSTIASTRSGFPYPAREIKKATWRLLRCCFHDALPGCCVDAAFVHVMKQLKLSTMQLNKIYTSALDTLANSITTLGPLNGKESIFVFNAIAATRDGIVTFKLLGDARLDSILDETGKQLPFQKDCISTDEHVHVMACNAVPPAGYATYTITRAANIDQKARPANGLAGNSVSVKGETVEVNGLHFTLVFEAGKLRSIKDKAGALLADGKRQAINELRIFNDRGDSYLEGTMPKKVFTTFGNKLVVVEDGPVRVVIRISSKLQCKNKLFFKPVNDVTQYVILNHHGPPRIDFITRIENRARNVRIQACFPVPVKQPVFRTEIPFGHIERDPTPQKGNAWSYKNKRFAHYDRIFPAINWIDVSSAEECKGMTIMNIGLPEQEISEDKTMMFLTLLRSTGYVGTLAAGNVPLLLGPFYSIPEAFEIGSHEFRYSLIFHDGDPIQARIPTEALGFNVPLVAVQSPGRDIKGEALPRAAGFITVEPEQLVITAIKRSEENPEEIVIRVLSTSTTPLTGSISIAYPLKEAWLLDLLERHVSKLVIEKENSVSFFARQQEILTLGFTINKTEKKHEKMPAEKDQGHP